MPLSLYDSELTAVMEAAAPIPASARSRDRAFAAFGDRPRPDRPPGAGHAAPLSRATGAARQRLRQVRPSVMWVMGPYGTALWLVCVATAIALALS